LSGNAAGQIGNFPDPDAVHTFYLEEGLYVIKKSPNGLFFDYIQRKSSPVGLLFL
jgi:hypothetical protein